MQSAEVFALKPVCTQSALAERAFPHLGLDDGAVRAIWTIQRARLLVPAGRVYTAQNRAACVCILRYCNMIGYGNISLVLLSLHLKHLHIFGVSAVCGVLQAASLLKTLVTRMGLDRIEINRPLK